VIGKFILEALRAARREAVKLKGADMPKTKIHHNTFIFVGDERKALFLRNEGDEKFANFVTERVFVDDNPPTHEQGTDRPGRGFASAAATRRSGMEMTEAAPSSIANPRPVAAGRQAPDFLLDLAKELDRDLRRSLVDGLLHLLGGVGQLICIDIDSYPTTRADHVPLRLQSRYGLFQFISAARALKLDLTGVNVRHS
jgi:protein required for attachment to host cells